MSSDLDKKRTDPGRPKPPTAEQQQKLDELRQKLKDGVIKFPEFTRLAHEILQG